MYSPGDGVYLLPYSVAVCQNDKITFYICTKAGVGQPFVDNYLQRQGYCKSNMNEKIINVIYKSCKRSCQ